MTTLLHIFDALAQDQEVLREDEDTKEVAFLSDSGSDLEDEEFIRKRYKPKKGLTGAAAVGTGKKEMVIHLFGTTPEGQTARLLVSGFQPFFYVELPSRDSLTLLKDRLYSGRRFTKDTLSISLVSKKKLFGYTGGRSYPFAELRVKNLNDFRGLRKLFLDIQSRPIFRLNSSADPLPVYDSALDPMLRFFHMRNISPSGWIRCDIELEETDDGTLFGECPWDWISPENKPPMAAAPFLKATWDIECYSANGEFPLAQKGYDRCAKLLYQNATDAAAVPEMIVGAFERPQAPPAGMEGLFVRNGATPNFARLRTLLAQLEPALQPILNDRSDCSAEEKEKRIKSLAKLLDKHLGISVPLAGDPVIQIGVVFVKQGSEPEKHIFVFGSCDPIHGVHVHSHKTEKDMILDWAATMELQNPDILEGYNVFGFDERYLWGRCVELGIENHASIQSLNRLVSLGGETKLYEKFLSSSALGDNFMYVWSAVGRLQIDLYHYVRRNAQLPSYKLDDVCMFYMSGKLGSVDMSAADKWVLKTKSTGDAQIGRFVVLLDDTGEVVVEKMRVIGVENGKAVHVEAPTDPDAANDAKQAVKWAIVKDDVPPAEIFRLHRGTSADRAKVAAYCVQDCMLVHELSKKLEVFNNAMSMANVCSVPVSYIFMRGQGIKAESLIFKYCFERGIVIETLESPPPRWATNPVAGDEETGEAAPATASEESYEGAICLDPPPGFYHKSPIGVCDFASLYPSTMISENISHDSLVWVKDYDLQGRLMAIPFGSDECEGFAPAGTRWTDISFDIWVPDPKDKRKHPEKIKAGTRVCRYAQKPDGSKDTIPDIVAKLLAARKAKRKEAEKETDIFRKNLLDAEQLAYKLTANSLYGQLGSATFKIRLRYLAASITAYGRLQILFAKAAIEKFYGPEAGDPRCAAVGAQVVYGDTDSLFVNFNPKDPETGKLLEGQPAIEATIALTEEAGKFITGALKPPHDFEYDKVFYPFIIFSKKRYVGNKYEDSPTEFKQTSMGIVLKRRDNAPVLKTIYGGAVAILLNERDVPKATQFVRNSCMDMVEGRMSLSQLTITKSLRAEYKASPPAHKVLADRIKARDPGNAPAAGERIGYVYISPPTGQQAPKLQGERIETPAYIRAKGLRPDARYYIEHQLMNPLGQLFSQVLEEMPGFVGPVAPEDRERVACDLLFRDAFATCDKKSARLFFQTQFGAVAAKAPAAATEAAAKTKKSTTKAAAPTNTNTKQLRMDGFLVDKELLAEIGRKKEKKEKKDKK